MTNLGKKVMAAFTVDNCFEECINFEYGKDSGRVGVEVVREKLFKNRKDRD